MTCRRRIRRERELLERDLCEMEGMKAHIAWRVGMDTPRVRDIRLKILGIHYLLIPNHM